MKIILTATLLFCLSITQPALGQKNDGHFEFSLGVGAWSSDQLFDGYTPGFIIGPSQRDYVNNQYSGTYYLTIKYFVSRRFAIGITGAYENESGDWQKNVDYGGAYDWQVVPLGTFKRQAFTFSPEIYFYYISDKQMKLYGTVGMGLTYRNEIDKYSDDYFNSPGNYYNGVNTLGSKQEADASKVQGNFYFSPIGISVGKKVCWFGELGIGYKGIINMGVSVKL